VLPVKEVQIFDGAVRIHRTDGGIDAGQHALCLAHGVSEQDAGFSGFLVGPPPRVDGAEHVTGRGPAEDRQRESGFADEGVAADGLERSAGRVGGKLVIARDDPYLAAVLDPHLRGPEDVSGRMERNARLADGYRFAIGGGLNVWAGPEAGAEQGFSRPGGQTGTGTRTGVVGMRVRDDRAVHRLPRIHEEIPGCTVEPGFAEFE